MIATIDLPLAMTQLGLLVAAGVCSALFSGCETGMYAVNRLRLDLRAARAGDRAARRLKKLLDQREVVLCVLLIGNNIANEAIAILAERLAGTWFRGGTSALVAAGVVTPLLFLGGEAIPKQVFRQHAETLAYATSGFLWSMRWLLWPFVAAVLPAAHAASRWARRKNQELRGMRHDEVALEALLLAGPPSLGPEVRETALGVGTSRVRPVREVMLRLADAHWLGSDDRLVHLRRKLQEAGRTRYPLRERDGTFRSYVYFLDPFLARDEELPLATSSHPLVALAPTTPLDEALARLESAASRMGVVRDESGRTLGFVMAGDLVAGLLAMAAPA